MQTSIKEKKEEKTQLFLTSNKLGSRSGASPTTAEDINSPRAAQAVHFS